MRFECNCPHCLSVEMNCAINQYESDQKEIRALRDRNAALEAQLAHWQILTSMLREDTYKVLTNDYRPENG